MVGFTSRDLPTHLALVTFAVAVLLGLSGPAFGHAPCTLGNLDDDPPEEGTPALCPPESADPNQAFAIQAGQFVDVGDGEFSLGGLPFRFVGTNAYFMPDAAMYGSSAHTVQMMHVANDLGFNVLRTWGFMNANGSGQNGETGALQDIVNQRLLQPLPRVYNDGRSYRIVRGSIKVARTVYPTYTVSDDPTAPGELVTTPNYFRRLDFVIATAQRHNVRLIFTFGNNWKEYGGVDQLLKWCAPGKPRIEFFTNPACIALYKDYISYVLNRWNPLTGRYYKDEPTIIAWELMNEPRCPNCDPANDGATLHGWMTAMAAHIKWTGGVRNAQQMVATGEEGFDCTWRSTWVADGYRDSANIRLHPWMYDGSQGACYGKNTRIADIDFGSFHMWPEYWRFKNGAVSEASWIADHVLIAKAGVQIPPLASSLIPGGGKPAVLGEFGSSRASRDTQFDGWLQAVATAEPGWPAEARGDGALVWQIMCPACANHATRLEVIYPPVTNESEVLCRHAYVANGNVPPPPDPCGTPTPGNY